MTIDNAILHLENMKWLLGVNNTTVDDIPLPKAIDDIIELLNPHVMTLEEVAALSDGSIVWLEDCDKRDVIAGTKMDELITTRAIDTVVVLIYFMVVRNHNIERVTASAEDYNIRWRCWTSKPSDEQRKAVTWIEA